MEFHADYRMVIIVIYRTVDSTGESLLDILPIAPTFLLMLMSMLILMLIVHLRILLVLPRTQRLLP